MKHDFDQEQYRREIDRQLYLGSDKKEQLAEEFQKHAEKTADIVEHGLQRGSNDISSKPYIPSSPEDQNATRMPRRLWRRGGAAAAAVIVVAVSAFMMPDFLSHKPGMADSDSAGIRSDTAAYAAPENPTAVTNDVSTPETTTETVPASVTVTKGKEAARSAAANSAAVTEPAKGGADSAEGNPTGAVTSAVNKEPAITLKAEKESYPVGTEGINLIIRDDNNVGCWWGLDYSLSIYQDGSWTALPFKENLAIPAIAQGLRPNPDADYTETITYIDFKNYLKDPDLAPGRYRASKNISSSAYYAEFTITDNG